MSYTAQAFGMPSTIAWHHAGRHAAPSFLPDLSTDGLLSSTSSPPASSSPLVRHTPPPTKNMDSLLLAASSEQQTNSAYERFHAHIDTDIISDEEWVRHGLIDNLQALTQQQPVLFGAVDAKDLTTQASLCLTKQPGPVYVATSNAKIESFVVSLVVNPLVRQAVVKTWKIGPLKMHVQNGGDYDEEDMIMSSTASKKRLRTGPKKRGPAKSINLNAEYALDGNLKAVIANLILPASGSKPVRLEFSCTVTDTTGKSKTFTTVSHPFIVVSNCNQWTIGVEVCLRRLVFANDKTQASFACFFNHLQMAFLATRCAEVERFFKPAEVYQWLMDCTEHSLRMDRDRQLLAIHSVVTLEMFDCWYEQASALIYDLHTSNVGKIFQHLWSRGLVGIGTQSPNVDSEGEDAHGTCRLSINTKMNDDEGDDRSKFGEQSYLVLKAKVDASTTRSYVLLQLDRDHLSHFFEHSRHSLGCERLLSWDDDGGSIPLTDLYAGGSFVTKAKKQR